MANLKSLAYELEGVLADARAGQFNYTCLRTIDRVRRALMSAEADAPYGLRLAAMNYQGRAILRIYVMARLHADLMAKGWNLNEGIALKCKDRKLLLRPGGHKVNFNRSGQGFRIHYALHLPALKTVPEPTLIRELEISSSSVAFDGPAWPFLA